MQVPLLVSTAVQDPIRSRSLYWDPIIEPSRMMNKLLREKREKKLEEHRLSQSLELKKSVAESLAAYPTVLAVDLQDLFQRLLTPSNYYLSSISNSAPCSNNDEE